MAADGVPFLGDVARIALAVIKNGGTVCTARDGLSASRSIPIIAVIGSIARSHACLIDTYKCTFLWSGTLSKGT